MKLGFWKGWGKGLSLRVGATGGADASDTVAPTCVITCDVSSPSAATSYTFTYTWSEDVTGFETGDAGIANGTKGTFTPVSASVYTLVVVPNALAEVTATVAASVCIDAAGNANAEATPLAITSTVSLYDTFTDADTTSLNAHTPNIKVNDWVEVSGDFDIAANKARQIVNTGRVYAESETGRSDVKITYNFTLGNAADEYSEFIFRAGALGTFWTFELSPDRGASDDWNLINAADGVIASGQLNLVASTDHTCRIELNGTSIEVYIDDGLVTSQTSTRYQTGTRHGIGTTNQTAADRGQRYDTITIINFP